MEAIKTIKVEQAEAGDRANFVSSYEEFKNKLILNRIENIFDNPRLKIKRDLKNDGSGGQRYIFNIDGQNKFSINEANIETFIRNYCKEKETKEQNEVEQEIYIDAQGLEIDYYKSSTQEELNVLKKKIEEQNKNIEKITDIESIKTILSRNLLYLEQQKEYAQTVTKSDKIERNLRKAYISQVQDRIDRLYRMKKSIEMLEQHQNKKYTIDRETANGKKEIRDIVMDDINGYDMKQTLMTIGVRLKEIADEEPDFIATRNAITNKEAIITAPYYEIIINDKKDAKKMLNALKKYNTGYSILDKLSLDASKKQLIAQDLQDLENYLNKVIDGPDTLKPSDTPFIPTHAKDFFALVKKDETLSSLVAFNKEKTKIDTENISPDNAANLDKVNNNTNSPETGTNNGTNNMPESNTNTVTDTRDFADKNYIDTFKEGGLRGMIRKTLNMFPNMKASSKNNWTNLLIVGGVGFGLFKLGKWFFSGKRSKDQKEKTPFRQRVLITAGITLGFNAFGTNPLKFGEQFIGGGLDPKTLKVQRPRAKNETVEDPSKELTLLELNQIFGNATITQLKDSMDPKTFKLTDTGYQKLLLSFQGTDEESKTKREIIQKMRNNKDKDILKTSFAKIGITPDNIDNLDQGKTVQEYTGNAYNTANEGADTRDGVDDPAINITDQVKDFNLTQDQKNKLIKYGNLLHDERPASSGQKVEFKEDNNNIYLKTYGERTRIDIEKLTIPGYTKENGDPIVFSSMKELTKAANLTNYLKSLFRGKAKGNKYDPFEAAGLVGKLTRDRGDIMFNDNDNSRYNPTHTEAIDGGRFGSISTVSPKIEEFKSEYISYLNKLQIRNESQATKDLAK